MTKEIIKKIILRLRGVRYKNGLILGYKKNLNKGNKDKIALLSYLTKPFLSFSSQIPHNNWGIARNLVRSLNQLGYVVDIVDWEDKLFIPKKKYDLFIGHGAKNFDRIAEKLNQDCRKIYFAAGLYWKFQNEQEARRVKEVNEKTGMSFKPVRSINDSEDGALKMAEAIVALGGEFTKSTYSAFSNVYTLDNFYRPDNKFFLVKKDFASAKKNFLFLSGSGNIHKGLDLVLEAFTQMPDFDLYVCTKLEDAFASVYRKELFETKNIHYLGFTKEGSPELRQIMYKCDYFVHPSCSEGSPGSVITCLSYGLQPIISRESNVSIDPIGQPLLQNTADKIIQAAKTAVEEKFDLSRATIIAEFAAKNFSEKIFLQKLQNCLKTVLPE